jgi:hypothetical protein
MSEAEGENKKEKRRKDDKSLQAREDEQRWEEERARRNLRRKGSVSVDFFGSISDEELKPTTLAGEQSAAPLTKLNEDQPLTPSSPLQPTDQDIDNAVGTENLQQVHFLYSLFESTSESFTIYQDWQCSRAIFFRC